MNRIQELEQQNLQDSWSILYLSLAGCLQRKLPERYEAILRVAVRKFGAEIGRLERKAHQAAGLRINLKTFFEQPVLRAYDPRLWIDTQRLNEQVALFNVIRCPFALCARQRGEEKLGKIFCEEYSAACIDSYTDGISQVNVSEVLTEPNNTHCRIAAYFRPANQAQELWKTCFSSFEEADAPASEAPASNNGPKIWERLAQLLVKAFLDAGVPRETLEEGISDSRRKLIIFLEQRAKCMERPFDEAFLLENGPFWNLKV